MSDIRLVTGLPSRPIDASAAPASTGKPEHDKIRAALAAKSTGDEGRMCNGQIVALQSQADAKANIAEIWAAKREGRKPKTIVRHFPGFGS